MNVIGSFSALANYLFETKQSESQGVLSRIKRSGSYLTLNKLISFSIPFAGRAGFEVLELRRGLLKAKIPFKGNTNHVGTMYAGALFTLAEIPGGVMAIFEFGPRYFPLLKEMNIKYLAPAKTDITVEFSLTETQIEQILNTTNEKGKCDFTLEGKLYDKQGELVAESIGHYQLKKRSDG